jgi:ElaB/YqjD/DUF883 family membrane-anchored ribosome-binding protein
MSNESTTSSDAKARFESGKEHVIHAAEDLKAAAGAKAQELRHAAETRATELRSRAEQTYGEYRAKYRTLREDGEQYVRDNPTKAVFTALGAGFILGLLFRR